MMKVAVFDLTDCEGCEVQILALKEKLAEITDKVQFINWRLVQEKNQEGPFDISFVEGTPLSNKEIELLKKIREQSKILVALGACACLGGVQALIEETSRQKFIEKIYSKNYKPVSKDANPIDRYVKVDYYLNGCSVELKYLEQFLVNLLIEKNPHRPAYTVCLECKANQNPCLLIKGEPCLGPITAGGCGALCLNSSIRCWGCFGPTKEANFEAMKKLLSKRFSEEEIKKILDIFFHDVI